jgi:hypothetical protein
MTPPIFFICPSSAQQSKKILGRKNIGRGGGISPLRVFVKQLENRLNYFHENFVCMPYLNLFQIFLALFTIGYKWQTLDTCRLNPLNAELNPICHFLALLGAHHIFHVGGLRVNRSSARISSKIRDRSRGNPHTQKRRTNPGGLPSVK